MNYEELIATEYGINIFLFLNSVFHNCPKKWLMGFFCSWVYISEVIPKLTRAIVKFGQLHKMHNIRSNSYSLRCYPLLERIYTMYSDITNYTLTHVPR